MVACCEGCREIRFSPISPVEGCHASLACSDSGMTWSGALFAWAVARKLAVKNTRMGMSGVV